MNRIFCLCIFFAVCSASASAQSADEKALTSLVSQLNTAIVKVDTNTLKRITDKDLSYGHSSGKVEDQQQFVIDVDKGPIFFQSIDVSDLTIKIAGSDAIVRHTFFGKMTQDGKPGEITLKVLQVWRKNKKGNWILFARQAVKPPL